MASLFSGFLGVLQDDFLGEVMDLRVGSPDIIGEVQGRLDQLQVGEDLLLIFYEAFEFCVRHGDDHFFGFSGYGAQGVSFLDAISCDTKSSRCCVRVSSRRWIAKIIFSLAFLLSILVEIVNRCAYGLPKINEM